MKKIGLKMTDKVSEHIENFIEIYEQYWDLFENIKDDLSEYLYMSEFLEEEIKFVQNIVYNIFDKIRLVNYITNEVDKDKKDIIRQAYVIANEPIPFYFIRKLLKQK